MSSPCASGHSPRLIALLANYRPLAPLALVWLNITNCRPGQGILEYASQRERGCGCDLLFFWMIIYCSKLNQRLLSHLRSDPRRLTVDSCANTERELMRSRYLEQGLGVKTQDGDTKLVLTLGDTQWQPRARADTFQSRSLCSAKLMDTICQVTFRQFHPGDILLKIVPRKILRRDKMVLAVKGCGTLMFAWNQVPHTSYLPAKTGKCSCGVTTPLPLKATFCSGQLMSVKEVSPSF